MEHDIQIGGESVASSLPIPLAAKILFEVSAWGARGAGVLSSLRQVQHRTWALALGIAGGVLVLVLWLLALQNAAGGGDVLLVVDPPQGLRVVIDGVELLPDSQSPFRLHNLDPGKHVLTIEKLGYLDQQIEVDVKPGVSISRGVLLGKIEGGFSLETEPAGATVWINGRPLEAKTPLVTRGVSPGTHMLRIAKGNEYAPKTILVDVQQDEVTIVPKQRLQRKIVEVSFESKPSGAVARLITGNTMKTIGRTPVTTTLDLSLGHRVRYDLIGYHSIDKELDVDAMNFASPSEGEILVHETVLLADKRPALASGLDKGESPSCLKDNPNRGTLSLQTKPRSRIYIDGQFVKNTPLVAHDIEPGTYDVTVENPTYQILDKFQVSISCGKSTKLTKIYI